MYFFEKSVCGVLYKGKTIEYPVSSYMCIKSRPAFTIGFLQIKTRDEFKSCSLHIIVKLARLQRERQTKSECTEREREQIT